MVQVELDRVGARVADEARVAGPTAGGVGVETPDDRDRRPCLDAFEVGEIPLAGVREVVDGGEVVECLGEVLGACFECAVELDFLVQDLFLEQ